jgi:hypothetical protein
MSRKSSFPLGARPLLPGDERFAADIDVHAEVRSSHG